MADQISKEELQKAIKGKLFLLYFEKPEEV